MDEVAFVATDEDLGTGPRTTLLVHVNGRPLPGLLARYELPSARREGSPSLAGSYAGLLDDRTHWPSRRFLGEPVLTWFGDGDTVLLGCECGDWGCWPFTARVDVNASTVRWSGFRTGHRDWDHPDLRDLVFDRDQYETALRATERR